MTDPHHAHDQQDADADHGDTAPIGEVLDAELLTDEEAADRANAAPADAEPADVESLLSDLERVTAERDQFLDAYRRAQADFENFKKQSVRRAEEDAQRRLGAFVERFLPVLDACDAARHHGAGEEVEPIVAALLGALEKEGLSRIEPTGEPFDPEVAEAVVHEPGDGGEHVVAEVMRPGYSYQGRLLRPAMVKVTD